MSSDDSTSSVDINKLPRMKITPRRIIPLNFPKSLVELKTDGSASFLGVELYIQDLLKRINNLEYDKKQYKKQVDNFHKFYKYVKSRFFGLPNWRQVMFKQYDIKSFKNIIMVHHDSDVEDEDEC